MRGVPWLLVVVLALSFELALCKVCYDDVGCFSRVFFTCHHRHPESPAKIGTTFTLFTRSTAGDVGVGESMDRKIPSTITTSKFDARRGTKILIHGWKGSMEGYRWTGMRDALLLREDVNVIMVDWSLGARRQYPTSRANSRVVGRQVARLIEALNVHGGALYIDVHIIGHSLGAHIGGYAGSSTHEMIGRISGLDPAGPGFGGKRVRNFCRLDKSDATFVDVIHTDGELIAMGGLGLMDELGHQDFYPNGGTDMPNCYFSIICDHMKAIAYYTESISKSTPCRFRPTTWAPKWDNYKKGIQTRDCRNMACPDMGYTASPIHDEGVFYLKTNKYYPFCQG
ncbi:pancreatic lipase-related protein 2 [Strongylocentrotus purpuratus]|uniref:Lipase domain-containing protein n=2 Tax=Strongylocentrotus purpuratus TaxID=7668 RepID=A0A7M7NNN2_STRPU|nr:pancreatic lipase-related protein 2 [Strongylocentrotus purpuratus]